MEVLEAELERVRGELRESRASAAEAARDNLVVVRALEAQVRLQETRSEQVDLARFVPRAEHEAALREQDARVQAANERMVGLDKRFRELWRDMKAENGRVREAAETSRKALEEERALRVAAEGRAQRAEARAVTLQRDGLSLQAQIKQAQEQLSLMRTIVRIRDETEDAGPAQALGFDALARRIGHIAEEVERQVSFALDPTR